MLYKAKCITAFSKESDPSHFQQVYDSEEEAEQFLRTSYSKAVWREFGEWHENGAIHQPYILPKYMDIVADCAVVMAKKGQCWQMRPILPYSNHFLRIPFKKGGSGLTVVVRFLPPGQFTVANTVLGKQELIQEGAIACYGPGSFCWMSTVGVLSAMYDETDPALACDKAEEAISHLPEWTGRRLTSWLNMSYHGGLVAWGKTNRDNRVNVDFARLMQMCRFDCASTLYKFC